MAILGHFIEGDHLAGLGLGLVGGEVGFLQAESRCQFRLGWFAFQFLGQISNYPLGTSKLTNQTGATIENKEIKE
jgi:hypothetical protein